MAPNEEMQAIAKQIAPYWHNTGPLSVDQRDFLIELLSKIKPKMCLEIGFCTGRSAVTTLVAGKPSLLISIDRDLDFFEGGRAHAQTLLDAFPNLKIIEGDSKGVLGEHFFATYFPDGVDFAVVDGDHSYPGCYNDVSKILPHLSPRGVLVVDDYRSGRPNGVSYAAVNQVIELMTLKHPVTLGRWHRRGKGLAVIWHSRSRLERWGTVARILPQVCLRRAKERLSRRRQTA